MIKFFGSKISARAHRRLARFAARKTFVEEIDEEDEMEQEQSEQDDDEEEEEDGSESEEEPEEPEQEQEDDELGREAARVVNIIPRQQILVAAVKLLREMEPTTPDASACNLQCFATAPPPREFWTDLARKAPMQRAWVGRTTYPDASSRGRKFSGALSLHTAHRIHLSPSSVWQGCSRRSWRRLAASSSRRSTGSTGLCAAFLFD